MFASRSRFRLLAFALVVSVCVFAVAVTLVERAEHGGSAARPENVTTIADLARDPEFPLVLELARDDATGDEPLGDFYYPLVSGTIVTRLRGRSGGAAGTWGETAFPDRQLSTRWRPLLDLNALSRRERITWRWRRADCVSSPPGRCLVDLSVDDEDPSTIREFDLATRRFVDPSHGFVFPRSFHTVVWESADTVLAAYARDRTS